MASNGKKCGNPAPTQEPPASESTETPKQEKVYTLFQAPKNVDTSKLKRISRPQMVKPDKVPVGGTVSGEILGVMDSYSTTVKSLLLHLKHESGQEFAFPITGSIRQSLAPGREKDDAKLKEHLSKEYTGKIFVANRLANEYNSQYKKDMYSFDVFITSK